MLKSKKFLVSPPDANEYDFYTYAVDFSSKYQALKYARKLGNGALVTEYITEFYPDSYSDKSKGHCLACHYSKREWIYFNNRLS